MIILKTKKTFLNVLTDVIPLMIVAVLGIFKVKLFLQVLGDETLGLYQLFNNIMMYVVLVDGGLGSALLYSLYKPNSDGDKKKFNEILSAGKKTFSKIGMYVFGMAFFISLFIVFLIKDCSFSYWYIVITFMLFAMANVIEYFFVPYNVLLEVKEKKYIFNLITQLGQIAVSIVEIILLLLHVEFALIMISHVVIRIIMKLSEVYICKKEFPDVSLNEEKKDYSFKKMLNSLIFHKVNSLIGSNVDSLIISSMLGLKYVAIYSTYNYIISMLRNILGKLSSSMTALVGNSLIKSKEKMYDLYLEFNSLLFYIAIILCVPFTLAIDGFIDMFYDGTIETSFIIAISFALILFVYIIKQDTLLFVNAAGLYKETKVSAMVDTVLNLILSFVLVSIIGIPGVLIATFISSMLSEYIMKTNVVHEHVFYKNSIEYYLRNIKFFIIFIIDLIGGYYLINLLDINSLLIWFIVFSIYSIINALFILLIFKLFGEMIFIKRLKILLTKKNKSS